ncbi:MAG: hypothetical protein U0Z53_02390 [Blastocatellia bacterium]
MRDAAASWFAAPVLTALSPSTVIAGSGALTLTVEGSGFVAGSVIRWNDSDRATNFVSSGQLTAAIPAADVALAGTVSIVVFNPGNDGGTSNALTLTITNDNPVPSLASLSPNTASAGSAGFTLTVNGAGFVSGSTVRWNASSRRTTFISSTQLTATISSADVATAGSAIVSVISPAPGGGTSNSLSFTISSAPSNPIPTLTSLSPNATLAGSDDLTLTVNGANFISGAKVRWNGNDRPTTFVSDTQLKATIPATDLVSAGTATVTAFNPAPGGGYSNGLIFSINTANPAPMLTEIIPASVTANSGAFTLNVTGSGFVTDSVVRWNGQPLETTFINDKELTAAVTDTQIAAAGAASVTVFNPAPGGGESAPQTMTINAVNPVPALSGMTPSAIPAGGSTFTLTVTGTGFVKDSVIRWNGANRRTTFISDKKLTTSIPASLVAAPGNASVVVFSSLPGGGTSNALSFSVTEGNPLPILNSLSPASVAAGSSDFTLTVNGSNFVNGSVVRWNGSPRPTTFVSYTQLTAAIPASDLLLTTDISVTVANPAPGGGVSGAVTFSITPPPNPVPVLDSIAPVSVPTGANDTTLTVNGSNFVEGSVVRWNGQARPTTFINSAQLNVLIPETDLHDPTVAAISVFNPPPEGGVSGSLSFRVSAGNPLPTLTSLSPASVAAGSGVLNLTVNGFGFVSSSIVRWNGGSRRTTFVSDRQLTATITAADVALSGTASVVVLNPAPDGGFSNALNFTINPSSNPVPTLSSISPDVVSTGSPAFVLTVTGINFVSGSVVRWNGQDRPTTYVSNGTLTAAIPASDVATSDGGIISIFNPAPGGGLSNTKALTVVNQLVNVSAARFAGGNLASESIVSAFGSGLAPGTQSATALPLPLSLLNTSVVVKDSAGAERAAPLFFVSPTQINYQLPPGTATGKATVTVLSGDGAAATGSVNVTSIAPGLFSADASGQGLAAALVLRTPSSGPQTWQPVGEFDRLLNRFVPLPVDPGSDTETAHLILYGIGIRARSSLAAVSATIAGITVPVDFAGAQGSLVGLDQINVVLPKTLKGKGEVEVVLIVDGIAANPVRITIR